MSGKDKDNLLAKCEEAKIVLSTEDYHRIQLIDYGMEGVARVPLELTQFKEIIQPQIEQAVATLYEAAKKAQISVAQLDGIIMVGGSCEMQPIQEVMAELFEKKNIKVIYPEQMQWSVATGAALVEANNLNYRLSQSIGVILSDDSFFPILQKGTVVPWCTSSEIKFGVVEETTDAHFIFSDEQLNTFDSANVPVKGFTTEGISLHAQVDNEMIANFTLQSTYMGQRHKRNVEINKIGFYYDLTDIEKPVENISSFSGNNTIGTAETCMFAGCTERAILRGFCSDHYKWERAESK